MHEQGQVLRLHVCACGSEELADRHPHRASVGAILLPSALWATKKPVYNNGNLLSHAYSSQKVSSVRISMNGQSRVFNLAGKDQGKYSLQQLVTPTTLRM